MLGVEPQVLRMHSKGTCQPTRCQSAKSSTTVNIGEFFFYEFEDRYSGDRNGQSTKVCARVR